MNEDDLNESDERGETFLECVDDEFCGAMGDLRKSLLQECESDREKEFANEFVNAMFELAEDWLAFADF